MTGEVEVQRFALGTLREFDLIQYLCWRDRLTANVACLVVAVSAKEASGSNLRKCARSDPCSNLLPQQLTVRFLRTVGWRHGISDDRTATVALPRVPDLRATIRLGTRLSEDRFSPRVDYWYFTGKLSSYAARPATSFQVLVL